MQSVRLPACQPRQPHQAGRSQPASHLLRRPLHAAFPQSRRRSANSSFFSSALITAVCLSTTETSPVSSSGACVRLQIDLAATAAKLVRLVDDAHRRTDRHHRRQFQHVMVEHTETTVANAHTDTELLCSSHESGSPAPTAKFIGAQRVIRPRRYISR